jgi:hypothetical protein
LHQQNCRQLLLLLLLEARLVKQQMLLLPLLTRMSRCASAAWRRRAA